MSQREWSSGKDITFFLLSFTGNHCALIQPKASDCGYINYGQMRPCGQTIAQDVLRRKRSGHNKTCGKPREDLGRIQTSTNQGERGQMQARLLTAWSPDF